MMGFIIEWKLNRQVCFALSTPGTNGFPLGGINHSFRQLVLCKSYANKKESHEIIVRNSLIINVGPTGFEPVTPCL